MTARALALAAMLCVMAASEAAPLRVKVEYDAQRDSSCAAGSIKEEWKAELLARQAEFMRIWEKEGPRLVAAVESITGKRFPAQEFTARLTLCNTPSESSPGADLVTVNMRFALASFTRTPVPMRYKVHTLFHELLHIYLFEHPVKDSQLLRDHAAEPERVRNHLHLLALQKATLLKLDEREVLNEIIAIDSSLPGGFYKRAWEIVNASEGEYSRYVAELSR